MLNRNEDSLKAENTANEPKSRSLIFFCILVQRKWFLVGKELYLYSIIPHTHTHKDKHALLRAGAWSQVFFNPDTT